MLDRTEAAAMVSMPSRTGASSHGDATLAQKIGAFGILVATTLGIGIDAAHAEILIDGDATALHLKIKQAGISDVFNRLSQTLQVRYRAAISSDKILDGSYSGSLEQVVKRLLDGHNYWIKKQDDTFEIVVLGTRGAHVVVPQATEAPRASTVAARWRTPRSSP